MLTLIMVVVCMFVGSVSVHGQVTRIDRVSERDMSMSHMTNKSVKKGLDVIERRYRSGKYTHGRIYRHGRYRVIIVKTYKDRKKLWKCLETRKSGLRYVEISVGRVDNEQGDGTCTDGTYTGYRLDGKPMYKVGTRVTTMYVYSDTNQYTDSIVCTREWVGR